MKRRQLTDQGPPGSRRLSDEQDEPLSEETQARFEALQNALLQEVLKKTRTLTLQRSYQQAADEAAALAWATPFPCLLFPALFLEKAAESRLHAKRQQAIAVRSLALLKEAAGQTCVNLTP